MRVDVYTLFPELIEHYAGSTILGRAQRDGLLEVNAVDLRSGATDERRTVDDTPFGGGAGMVLMADPLFRCVEAHEEERGAARPLIALVPHGRPFDQATAQRLSALDSFSLLCGRYEGIDQRVLDELVDEEISVGDFVLAGGELAALCVLEATARLVPGVLGNEASTTEESFASGLLEYPQWTKPATFRGHEAPAILRSGDHAKVARWRHAKALERTVATRPDLIEARGGLSKDDRAALAELAALEQGPQSG
jgi:tRNA (guanine37-N1)-methyltransferase